MKALGAELVVLSPELATTSAAMAAKQHLTFPILYDRGCAAGEAFGLAFTLPPHLQRIYRDVVKIDLAARNGEPSWKLPMPARFVIDKAGIIRAADVDPDYRTRREPAETMAVLRTLA